MVRWMSTLRSLGLCRGYFFFRVMLRPRGGHLLRSLDILTVVPVVGRVVLPEMVDEQKQFLLNGHVAFHLDAMTGIGTPIECQHCRFLAAYRCECGHVQDAPDARVALL